MLKITDWIKNKKDDKQFRVLSWNVIGEIFEVIRNRDGEKFILEAVMFHVNTIYRIKQFQEDLKTINLEVIYKFQVKAIVCEINDLEKSLEKVKFDIDQQNQTLPGGTTNYYTPETLE